MKLFFVLECVYTGYTLYLYRWRLRIAYVLAPYGYTVFWGNGRHVVSNKTTFKSPGPVTVVACRNDRPYAWIACSCSRTIFTVHATGRFRSAHVQPIHILPECEQIARILGKQIVRVMPPQREVMTHARYRRYRECWLRRLDE